MDGGKANKFFSTVFKDGPQISKAGSQFWNLFGQYSICVVYQ
jgi:hypothetical protein